MRRRAAVALLLICATAGATAARPPEPRLFRVPPKAPDGTNPWVFEVHPEYRTRMIRIDPLEVNGTTATRVFWGEQRLRLDVTFARAGIGAIFVQADILDGVLFGDNGEFGKVPHVNSGLGIASKYPNNSGWEVGLLAGGDPLDTSGYGPVLRGIEPLRINFAYGEVMLPVGVLRVGRQPTSDSNWVAGNDGRTGRNRWGASSYHQAVDRVAFGTKLSEIVRYARDGKDYVPNTRLDDGVIFGAAFDFLVLDDITVRNDDLRGVAFQLSWMSPGGPRLGNFTDLELTAILTHRWDRRFNTALFGIPMRLRFTNGPFSFRGDVMLIRGSTRELSAGLAKLTNDPVTDQKLDSTGAEVLLEYRLKDFTFVAQWGYASGDSDPRSGTAQTSFTWPRDNNLGLVLFEHTLNFQSARSAAVGIENLRQLEAESFPLTELATEGRVTDVNALFPQVFWDPHESLRLKAGVLFAWAASPVTDPIQTLLAYDGKEISDDALNYNGGKPGKYWGTELDLGVEYRYREFFEAVLEGGVLFPGSGLEDENGDAVPSWLVELRMTFAL
ncbi:MAG: hypothetical protein H6744_18875 [Deltaproteobacteria bacterium]|nr:hypothetical protein [Deltaproteobacteria bacterium]MCB9788746.1 hypothetical protein [Deltaproteobacteria bacterium]